MKRCPSCDHTQVDSTRVCEVCAADIEKKPIIPKEEVIEISDSEDVIENSEDVIEISDTEEEEDPEMSERWSTMRGPDDEEERSSRRRRPEEQRSRFVEGTGAYARLRTAYDNLEDPDRSGRRGGSARDQHNIFDAEYNNIWVSGLKVLTDAPNATDAMNILKRLKTVCDPILRAHGWRVQELHEWTGGKVHGTCWPNGRGGASIALVLRIGGTKRSPLKSFDSILAIMLHEMTHIEMNSNNHGAPFRALNAQLRNELHAGGNAGDFGSEEINCSVRSRQRRRRRNYATTGSGLYRPNQAKKRPLLKGKKMLDGRTKDAKAAKTDQQLLSKTALAAMAAERRLLAAINHHEKK